MSYTSYYNYQKYETRNGSSVPCYPATYSIDGDGTKPLVKKQDNDPNCGYIPPVEPIYRWVNLSIYTDYVCDNGNKFYKQQEQVSYDNGLTWSYVSPAQYRKGDLYESGSTDCVEYRWVDLDPNVDFYCKDTCNCQEPIYQWNADLSDYKTFGPYTCYTEYYQVSTDGGNTWENVYPIQKRIDENCVGCKCEDQSTDVSSCYWYYYIVNIYGVRTPYDRNCDDTDISGDERGIGVSTKDFYCYNGCLKTIGDDTFSLCTNLVSAYFPCSIEHLGSNLFNSNKMESITIAAKTPPTINSTTFSNSNNCPIYVYEPFVDKYKTAWPSLANRIKPITQ